jgi:hypothetical protein
MNIRFKHFTINSSRNLYLILDQLCWNLQTSNLRHVSYIVVILIDECSYRVCLVTLYEFLLPARFEILCQFRTTL